MVLTGVDVDLDVSVRGVFTASIIVGKFLTDVFLRFRSKHMPCER